jgi:outer membrane protein TolC
VRSAQQWAAVVLLALGGVPTVAAAAERSLSLDEALALAERQNPELQAAQARVKAQTERTAAVRRQGLPHLGLSLDWSRTNLPAGVFGYKLNSGQFTSADFDVARINAPAPLSHIGTTLSLDVPIDVFGKIGTMARAMAAYGDAATEGTREAAQEIRVRVVEAYRRVALARQAVGVTERVAAVAKARESEIEARVEAGSALQADLLRARARRRQREADVAERKGQQRVATAGLTRLLGAGPETEYVALEAPPSVAALADDEAVWTERALRQRPVIRATRRRAEAASSFVKNERNALLPDVGAAGQVFDNRLGLSNGSQAWALGVGLKWSAFDAARGKRQAAATAEQRAAEEDVRAALDQVRLEVAMAHRRAITARERYAAAAGGAEEGREALRVVQERRKAGMATLTDELETETAALGAALEEIGAAAEVAIADAALKRAAGEI